MTYWSVESFRIEFCLRLSLEPLTRIIKDHTTFEAANLISPLTPFCQDIINDPLGHASRHRCGLLLLAHFGKESKLETVIAKISQEMLAEMIGTTRSRQFLHRWLPQAGVD